MQMYNWISYVGMYAHKTGHLLGKVMRFLGMLPAYKRNVIYGT